MGKLTPTAKAAGWGLLIFKINSMKYLILILLGGMAFVAKTVGPHHFTIIDALFLGVFMLAIVVGVFLISKHKPDEH